MKTIIKKCGSQESNAKTHIEKRAHVAHLPSPVHRRTKPQNLQPSIRRPFGYENSDTQPSPQQWIPASVTANSGRNDKIHVSFDIAIVICDDKDDARSFVSYCGAAPMDQRNEYELYSMLFNTTSLNGDGNTLDIRSMPMRCGKKVFQAPWVKGGKKKKEALRFRRICRPDGKVVVFVTANLDININRALNHQRVALAKGCKDAIFQSTGIVAIGLCGNDNLAPFDLVDGEHDRARKACFEMVASAIHADVKRAAEITGESGGGYLAVTGNPGNFSLQVVETCWDFGGAGFDAVKELANLTPALLEHGGKRGWIGNAGTVTIEFSKWERLVVYAKAPDRLRFEVRQRPPEGNGSYSSATVAEMLGKLDGFREQATVKTNAVLSFLRSQQAASRTGIEWEAYAIAWGASCGNSEASKAIFQILRQQGRIQGGKCVQCIAGADKVIRNAKRNGLIQHSNGAFRPVFPEAP